MARILVIDDEEVYLRLVATMLTAREHHVYTVADSREALATFESLKDELDLVILDLQMPHISGTRLFSEIRGHSASLPIILSTGCDAEDFSLPDGPRLSFLRKPFSLATLHAAVDAALAG